MIKTMCIFYEPIQNLQPVLNKELEKLQKSGYSIIDIKMEVQNQYPWVLIVYKK